MVGSLISAWVLVDSCKFSPLSTLVVVPYAIDARSVGIVSAESGEVCRSKTIAWVFVVGNCVEGVGMAAWVVGWWFWLLSTGWVGGTLIASNVVVDGVLRTERIFNLFLLNSFWPNLYSAVTKIDFRFVFLFDSTDTIVTRPQTFLFFQLDP